MGDVPAFCQSIGCDPNRNVSIPFLNAGLIPAGYKPTTYSSTVFPFGDTNDALLTPVGNMMVMEAGDWSTYGNVTSGLKIVPVFLGLDKATCIQMIVEVSSRFKDDQDLVWVETPASSGARDFPMSLDEATLLCTPPGDGRNYLMFYFDAY